MITETLKWMAAAVVLALLSVAVRAGSGKLGADIRSTLTLSGRGDEAALPTRSIYHLQNAWQDQNDGQVKLSDLRGRPVVLTMFFSHCNYACPLLVQDMKNIESKLTQREAEDVLFVLASFDVERDTPAVLKSYATEKKLDVSRWRLLHGDADTVRDLAAVLGVRYRRETDGSFAHSNIITVLAPDGVIVYQQEGLGADSTLTVRALQKLVEEKNAR